MTLRLDRLESRKAYWEKDGRPTLQMQLFWQKFADAIETAFNGNEELDAAQQELIEDVSTALSVAFGTQSDLGITNAFIRTRDSAAVGLTIDADTSSITVSTHDRQYLDPSETVSVTGDTITGLTSSTTYYIHYTDPDFAGGAVGYQVATSLVDAVPSPTEPYRHYVGTIEVPTVGTASGTPVPDPYWKVTTVGGGGGSGDLVSTNNLSDVANAATALSNLGGQPLDADLTALAANSTDGLWAHTGAGTGAARTLTGPAAGITVSNGNGVAGNPTLALANDLSALEAMSGTGIVTRTASETYAQRTITGTAGLITVTNGDGVAGNPTITRAFSGALVKKSADQTTANYSAFAVVAWDAEEYDTDNYHDTVTNNTRLTVQTAGHYAVMGQISGSSLAASDYVRLAITRYNSSGVAQSKIGFPSPVTEISATPSVAVAGTTMPISCAAGDYFELNFDTESDVSITIEAVASWFGIWRVA